MKPVVLSLLLFTGCAVTTGDGEGTNGANQEIQGWCTLNCDLDGNGNPYGQCRLSNSQITLPSGHRCGESSDWTHDAPFLTTKADCEKNTNGCITGLWKDPNKMAAGSQDLTDSAACTLTTT